MTQEEGFPASGWMTAGNSMCRRRNQAVKTGGSGKSAERKNQGFIVAQLQAYVSDLYSHKKETTFAAYLCLGTEDGKASFRLEFPKKKEKKHLPVNDTGREELNERKTCL